MSLLLIDNSNTRTKFALSDGNTVQAQRWIIPTKELNAARLEHLKQNLPPFERVAIASVVPSKNKVLVDFFSDFPVHSVNWQSMMPIGIDYPNPEQIGADRLVNAVGAWNRYKKACIVIDFGTAVTFDVINEQGNYLGGVIAPGLNVMTHYLHEKTALLPKINLEEPISALGKSTIHAMQAGAFWGYRGLIQHILKQLILEMNCQPIVIATGGDAELITKDNSLLQDITAIHADITFEGLLAITRHNQT